jgi:hypothetical protein
MSNRRDFLTATALSTLALGVARAQPNTVSDLHRSTLEQGTLKVMIGDNTSTPEHRPGYNGVWELFHSSLPRSIFVPGIAGLNLEHAITGVALTDDDHFFEPRRAAMQLKELGPGQVELYQPPTPYTYVESWTVFQCSGDCYLDMSFRCRIHRGPFPNGYLALFWASYINAPEDKSMYFLGTLDGKTEQWLQLCTQFHNDQSTVRHRDDTFEMKFADDGRPALFKSISPVRYTKPMFYGHIGELIWGVMFDKPNGIRFTHSPSGGGFNQAALSSNPAWDFQYVIENPDTHREYGFSARTFLVPQCSRDELLNHLAKWQQQSTNNTHK